MSEQQEKGGPGGQTYQIEGSKEERQTERQEDEPEPPASVGLWLLSLNGGGVNGTLLLLGHVLRVQGRGSGR